MSSWSGPSPSTGESWKKRGKTPRTIQLAGIDFERSAVKLNGGGPAEGGFRVRRTAAGAFCLTVRSAPKPPLGCVGLLHHPAHLSPRRQERVYKGSALGFAWVCRPGGERRNLTQ
jgi:hypothetical protein